MLVGIIIVMTCRNPPSLVEWGVVLCCVGALHRAPATATPVTTSGTNPAASKRHKEVMEVLLAHGANVDTPDKVRPFPSSLQPAQPAEWSLYV